MTYQLQHTEKDGRARAGLLTTDHGVIHTPIFMPVGTVGSVKGIHLRELIDDLQAEIILGNTYHLYLRPGTQVLERVGGLHRFNGFSRPRLSGLLPLRHSQTHRRRLRVPQSHRRQQTFLLPRTGH